MKQEMRVGQEHMQEVIISNQEKMDAAIHRMRAELDEIIRHYTR
jgi:hypothetical protein